MRGPEERDGTGVPRILGIGDATVDIYLSDHMQYPGGNTVNVAVHAARCKAAASWLGCLGRDALGALVRDALLVEGVDITHARCLDGANPWSRIRHTNGERSFAGSDPGVRARYALTEADDQFIARHDVVHTSVHSDLDGEIARLRAASRLLSYDYSEHWHRPGVAATMRHVDIAFLSTPERDDEACAALLAWCTSQGPGIAVATRGAQGAVALAGGRMLRQSPPAGRHAWGRRRFHCRVPDRARDRLRACRVPGARRCLRSDRLRHQGCLRPRRGRAAGATRPRSGADGTTHPDTLMEHRDEAP